MPLQQQYKNITPYLESSDIIDFGFERSREVTELSHHIKACAKDEIDFIHNAFVYVRDKISHSADINGKTVTCKASEVLKAGEGICYAKSHLLAAILRCNLIPTGFCYQKLILDDETAPHFVLHGLNAVYIEQLNQWIRLDARGNKLGINAQFSLEKEKLAFPVRVDKGEEDIPIIFAHPDKNVIQALTSSSNFETLWASLPATLFTSTNGR